MRLFTLNWPKFARRSPPFFSFNSVIDCPWSVCCHSFPESYDKDWRVRWHSFRELETRWIRECDSLQETRPWFRRFSILKLLYSMNFCYLNAPVGLECSMWYVLPYWMDIRKTLFRSSFWWRVPSTWNCWRIINFEVEKKSISLFCLFWCNFRHFHVFALAHNQIEKGIL